MSPIIPSRYGHPKYNIFPQKTRASAGPSGFKTNLRSTPGGDSRSRRKQRIEESKITLHPAEDDDGDNFFSKQLATARFQRNHRLINVLFSDIVVDTSDPQSDNDKLQACKKRVQSLTEYQKKIDNEMVELNERFNVKKAKIMEDGKKFAEKIKTFVSNSKKELETLRAAQEVRRQQEAARRALAKTEPPTNHNTNFTSHTNKHLANDMERKEAENKSTPMEVSFNEAGDSVESASNRNRIVAQVLESILNSVANPV